MIYDQCPCNGLEGIDFFWSPVNPCPVWHCEGTGESETEETTTSSTTRRVEGVSSLTTEAAQGDEPDREKGKFLIDFILI